MSKVIWAIGKLMYISPRRLDPFYNCPLLYQMSQDFLDTQYILTFKFHVISDLTYFQFSVEIINVLENKNPGFLALFHFNPG